MAKLRHIAIAAEDPYATAEFFKQAFDFVEVRRTEPKGEGSSYGVFLSDGTINMAILHFGWDQGHGLDYRGIHHLGVLVDDVDAYTDKLEKLGADCFAKRPPGATGLLRDEIPRPRQGHLRHHRPSVGGIGAARCRHRGAGAEDAGEGGVVRLTLPKREGAPMSSAPFPIRPSICAAAARLAERSLALAPCAGGYSPVAAAIDPSL